MRRAFPLLLAIAAFVAATLIWIGGSRAGSHAFDIGSASNTSPTGLSLAYAYLGRQPGQAVTMLTTPLRSGVVPGNAVVLRVEEHDADQKQVDEHDDDDDSPARAPQSLLTSAEDEFVRGGGRLVLASSNPGSFAVRSDAGKVAAKVFPIWPGLDTLALPEPRGLAPRSLPGGMHTLFAANGEAVVARQEIGAGDVIVVSVPEMFENQNIASDHHLQLLLAIAAEPAAVQPAGRRRYAGRRYVYFDEVVHGMAASDGMLAILTDWRLGPLLVLLFIAAILTLWRNSKRVGPAEDEDRESRSDAIDLVASLGALYGRSMSSAESIALYHAALERSVAAQSGLRGDALHKRVAELTHGFAPSESTAPLSAHAFQQHLTTINDAFRTLERSARGGHDANHR